MGSEDRNSKMINSKQIQCPQMILVVDDQELNRDLLGDILEEKYELLYAENGKEALEQMREHADKLSLVLLDLMMPVMSGMKVLETVREDEELRRIPIIVLTADRNAELKALQLGALDFITKPFDVREVILARVDRMIELSEGRQLISAAEHDQLTMLYTRNFFREYANRLHQYHPEMQLDAIVLNIEQFHSINALNGREFGDEVLRFIGKEIRSFLEETQGIACRTDADQFNIYCVSDGNYQAILDRFQTKVNMFSYTVSVRLRMGVRPWRKNVEPLLLFDQARAACNMIRGDYQNPLMIYDEDVQMREMLNRRLLNDLQMAVDKKQFHVYYQPKYDVRVSPPRLCSAEALVRWQHPNLGLISPGDFIPLFEGNGMISLVDSYVWDEAAGQIARWKEKYNFSLPISVNLSRADIFSLELEEKLIGLIKSNGLSFRDLKLEVTESAYTDNAHRLLEVVARLRELGFEIEMDDFGAGYSTLNMLSEMPIDVLKMDMKFVRNIEKSETDFRLVELILDIAKYLNLSVVAEGVETAGQLELLQNAGCDLVQGYYFSCPLPAEEFEKLIQHEVKIKRG